jgi:hypothetical protein
LLVSEAEPEGEPRSRLLVEPRPALRLLPRKTNYDCLIKSELTQIIRAKLGLLANRDRTSAKVAFAKLYDRKTPITAAEIRHLGAEISGRSGNPGSNGRISCKSRCSIDPRSRSGKPCLHVFR